MNFKMSRDQSLLSIYRIQGTAFCSLQLAMQDYEKEVWVEAEYLLTFGIMQSYYMHMHVASYCIVLVYWCKSVCGNYEHIRSLLINLVTDIVFHKLNVAVWIIAGYITAITWHGQCLKSPSDILASSAHCTFYL